MIQVSAPRFRSIQRTRLLRRLLLHHLVLFALATISVGAIFITRPYRDVWMKASFATAYLRAFFNGSGGFGHIDNKTLATAR